jgi:hypothetical protein
MNFADALMAQVAIAKQEALAKTEILPLGELIARIEAQPQDQPIKVERQGKLHNPGDVDSYRGYYSDLYIDFTSGEERTTGDFLDNLVAAEGKSFEGYKGGDFTMDQFTPVWVDMYSCCDGTGAIGVESRDGVTVITTGDCSAF